MKEEIENILIETDEIEKVIEKLAALIEREAENFGEFIRRSNVKQWRSGVNAGWLYKEQLYTTSELFKLYVKYGK